MMNNQRMSITVQLLELRDTQALRFSVFFLPILLTRMASLLLEHCVLIAMLVRK